MNQICTHPCSIAAVIVAFRPDLPLLQRLVDAICPQVDILWLVNNGTEVDLAGFETTQNGLEIVQFDDNMGIGAAIDYAAQRAEADGYTYLLTLDQDSIPAADMVEQLLKAYLELAAQNTPVAAVGPAQVDRRSAHHAPFIAPIDSWPPRRKLIFPPTHGVIEVDHLITSGLLAPISVYQAVGAPRADLFIDYVDIEWSLRARKSGLKLFAVGNAQLKHSIGDSFKQFRGKQVPIHSPLRHYYLMRNGIFLQKLPTISLTWKMSDAFQLLKKFIFFTLFLPERGKRLRMMLRGLRDGLRGKLGIYCAR